MKLFFFLLINIFFFSSSFAYMQIDSRHKEYIEAIFENKETCIQAISYDKIYFNSKKIKTKNNETFLQLNKNELLPLPILGSDSFGTYLSISDLNNNPGYVQCPYCGYWRTKGLSHCINPKCPLGY